ncbi:hypothetical protein V2J09_023876 [Rumex salicifolius]
MDAVAEGLWGMSENFEKKGEVAKAIKCLEAICQSHVSFLPIVEVKTRIRIAAMLLRHTHNVNQAKHHLERSQLLLKSIPSCFELKFRAYSLLSQCYHLVGSIPPQKQILNKALELVGSSGNGSQLANALIIDGDYRNAISTLEHGYNCAAEIFYPELQLLVRQMFFATSILHVSLMQWSDTNSVEGIVAKCDETWGLIEINNRQKCFGLLFYNELLHIFYRLRICDLNNATQHAERLDAAVKDDMERIDDIQRLTDELNVLDQTLLSSDLNSRSRSELLKKQVQLQDQIRSLTGNSTCLGLLDSSYNGRVPSLDKLQLAPAPIDGEWLPRTAVYALVDLVVKKGEGGFGMTSIGNFLENKVAVELTRSEFVEAQEALVQMRNMYIRFPTILQACASVIEMLRGQYAHSTGCFHEATFHYIEAAKLTDSKSLQAMCQVYTAISYICIGDSESSTQATLYEEVGERGNAMENADFQNKKVEDLHKKLAEAHSSIHHLELIDKVKIEVPQLRELDTKRSPMGVSFDIPESIGLIPSPAPAPSSSRFIDLDSRRRGKRKI